ncbi:MULTISPECIES: hypothetical protein [Heyndrickxia]|uniref:Uncharacterized protein n=1 Tax=Heyndrickxia sporothermodurans TaxID=46224 RepID=A0A150LHT4_9BACI|nr:hypothetical protein [Heyndrickxia sporothermodurans]KYD11506.1 hypothetical protein B4102_0177 [Heyndrickxia sporothermodurans]MBL5768585.1 hypothetical protein [Heyndrickxia sporothermodurans]MBL5772312.1 hypothetical protein [Heyndrickxia sporothermodurans]MBL5780048.1 hypothetical protein [Heyndrickxia sporothermodurans]MBL5783263.1 hypothetical protein [Heyndrickxia sporothermodurans]
MAQIILWGILIISWLSLFFLKKDSIRRFMPVAIFAALLVTIIEEIGYVYNWWTILGKIFPWEHFITYPLTYGPFLVGTIWIFHFTYDKSFWVYILTNAIIDAFHAFVMLNLFTYFGIYRLNNINNFGLFILIFCLSFVIYPYQIWQDKIMKKS